MLHVDLDIFRSAQVRRQPLGAKNRTVLPAGAAKANGQVRKPAPAMMVHCLDDQVPSLIEKLLNRGVLFQKLDYIRVPSRPVRIFGKASGIRQRSAIKDKAAAMAYPVARYAAFVRETLNMHCQSRSCLPA